MAQKRIKTDYPGVIYIESKRRGGAGVEKVFYIIFKQKGKQFEEKVGRQFADKMTPAKANGIRADRIEGRRQSAIEVRAAAKAAALAEAEKPTIDRLWLSYRESRPLKGIAQDRSRYDKYLKPAFKNKITSEIFPLDVDRLRLKLTKQKKSPQTIKHVLVLLRRIINYGVDKQLCTPLSFKIKPPSVDNEKTEFLQPEELARLLATLDAEEKNDWQTVGVMRLALLTGMRRGEILKLRWQDIDLGRGLVSLKNPKGGKGEVLPISEAAQDVIKQLPKTEYQYLFPGKGGAMRKDINRGVKRIREAAKLPEGFRPIHGLRHQFASTLAGSGVDLYTVQRLLTHKDAATTQRYAHLTDEAKRQGAQVAADAFKAVEKTAAKVINLKKQNNTE